ncbi:hypothetical protein D3C75_732690 [compost metagenome]
MHTDVTGQGFRVTVCQEINSAKIRRQKQLPQPAPLDYSLFAVINTQRNLNFVGRPFRRINLRGVGPEVFFGRKDLVLG